MARVEKALNALLKSRDNLQEIRTHERFLNVQHKIRGAFKESYSDNDKHDALEKTKCPNTSWQGIPKIHMRDQTLKERNKSTSRVSYVPLTEFRLMERREKASQRLDTSNRQ